MKYCVLIREVNVVPVYIEADSEEKALEAVNSNFNAGVTDYNGAEFSHILDSECWTVEEIKSFPNFVVSELEQDEGEDDED